MVVLGLGERVLRHLNAHPWRLAFTLGLMLALSFSLLALSIVYNVQAAHNARVDICESVNELSRKIYVTLADFSVPEYERTKFRPTTDCETVP